MPEYEVRVIGWWSADFRESKVDGKTFMSAHCGVCGKEVTRHEVFGPEATAEQVAEAQAAQAADAEFFLTHLETSHPDKFKNGDTIQETNT